jgi:hypothetical protein
MGIQGMEYQFILNFIKTNKKLFLRIIASDIHNTERTISTIEFNTFNFLFTTEDKIHIKKILIYLTIYIDLIIYHQ